MGLFWDPFKIISFASGLIAINRRLLDDILSLDSAVLDSAVLDSYVPYSSPDAKPKLGKVLGEVASSAMDLNVIVFDERERYRILLGRRARHQAKQVLFAASQDDLQRLVDLHPDAVVIKNN